VSIPQAVRSLQLKLNEYLEPNGRIQTSSSKDVHKEQTRVNDIDDSSRGIIGDANPPSPVHSV
jgi:hypothetical protein